MLCPKCGNELPEQTTLCPHCGANLGENAPAEPRKGNNALAKFLVLNNRNIALILAIICALSLVLSYFVVMGKSFENIPVVSWIAEDAKDEMKDAKKELKELVKEAEDNLDDLKEDLERKEYKTAKNLLKAAKNCSRSMSVNNLKKFASAVNKIGDLDSDDLGVLDGIGNAVGDSILSILKIISTVVLIGMLFALAFSACGGFLKIRGLVITGMIFSVIYAAIFCGFLFVLLFTAVHIALYIFIGKAKQEIAAEKAAI